MHGFYGSARAISIYAYFNPFLSVASVKIRVLHNLPGTGHRCVRLLRIGTDEIYTHHPILSRKGRGNYLPMSLRGGLTLACPGGCPGYRQSPRKPGDRFATLAMTNERGKVLPSFSAMVGNYAFPMFCSWQVWQKVIGSPQRAQRERREQRCDCFSRRRESDLHSASRR